MLWDNGAFRTEGDGSAKQHWAKGHLRLRPDGEKLQGKFELMRMRGKATGKEWLLVKGSDGHGKEGWNVDEYEFSVVTQRRQSEIASGSAGRPVPQAVAIKPMLALLAQKLPEGPDSIYEVKGDGVRTMLTIAHGSVTFASRNGLSYDTYFPELKDLPAALALSTRVADGEIVAMDSSGKISFQAIQPRLCRSSFGKAEDGPHGISLYLFDLLFKDGKDLRKLPLRERRALLSKTLRQNDRVKLSGARHRTRCDRVTGRL